MRLASHQPDFLPYSGFFYKIAKADVFDLAIYDQYSHMGYHRRVTIKGKWMPLVVDEKANYLKPIWAVTFDVEASFKRVEAVLRQHYSRAPYFNSVAYLVLTILAGSDGNLSRTNAQLIKAICDYIGIATPILTALPLTKPKGHGILQLMEFYGADTYLSGNGAKEYIGNEFAKAGKQLEWSNHAPVSSDSIIGLMMWNSPEEVLKIVLQENPDGQTS